MSYVPLFLFQHVLAQLQEYVHFRLKVVCNREQLYMQVKQSDKSRARDHCLRNGLANLPVQSIGVDHRLITESVFTKGGGDSHACNISTFEHLLYYDFFF